MFAHGFLLQGGNGLVALPPIVCPVPPHPLNLMSRSITMLVVMQAQATEEQVRAVCQKIESLGYRAHSMPGAQRTAIGITGNQGEVESGTLEEMPGVQEVSRVTKPYKLVSRDTKPDNTVIKFSDSHLKGSPVTIGGPDLAIIAGPCGIETRDHAFRIAERVALAGDPHVRPHTNPPRSSPYSFQGFSA